VNDLNCTQGDICWRFAKSGNEDERFDGVGWRPAARAVRPILDKAVAWIDCSVEEVYEMGDHYFVLGRVNALDADEPATDDEGYPLIFFKGMLGRFVPAD
jgi:3-hydroxy-9,10-secoandrosta-1,3,5(10)-triene-9,17-dione monooxygenase reductase component